MTRKKSLVTLILVMLLCFLSEVGFAVQPILGIKDLYQLLHTVTARLQPLDENAIYVDLDQDGTPELLVGGNDQGSRGGHFFIFAYRGSKYVKVLQRTWDNSFLGVYVEYVWFDSERKAIPLVIIKYSPGSGTGWLPICREIIRWDGKTFRSVWDGLTDEVNAVTEKQEITNSLLRFDADEQNNPILEVLTIYRTMNKGIPGDIASTVVSRYRWDGTGKRFVK